MKSKDNKEKIANNKYC